MLLKQNDFYATKYCYLSTGYTIPIGVIVGAATAGLATAAGASYLSEKKSQKKAKKAALRRNNGDK